jgi:hypothetical protein
MAEHEPGRRERLSAKKAEQTQAATPEGEATPRGGHYGSAATRAAALIAGVADPGPGDEEDAPEEGDAEAGEAVKPGKGQQDEPDGAEADDEGEQGDEGTPPESLRDARKKLGLSRNQMNALTVEVAGVAGGTMTLGELLAKAPEIGKLDKQRTELDDERGSWELERVSSYRNISAIIDQLPKNAMTAGLLRQLEAQHENTRARELETLHFARPRWQDANYAQAARAKIHATAKEYGFSRAEVDGLMDHRQVLLVQDYADLREKVRAGRDQARKVAEGSAERPSGQRGAAAVPAPPANGSVQARRANKPTQEVVARNAGAIMRRR